MNVFEKLKEKIQELFFLKKKDFTVPPKIERQEQNDETTILIEDSVRNNSKENRGLLITNVSKLSFLPSIYLLINVATIVILLVYKVKDSLVFENDILIGEAKVMNFFNLSKVNPFVYHLYTCSNSLIGMILVFLLFTVLKQRFRVPEYQKHTFKLHIMFIFGFLTHFIQLGIGFIPYVDNYKQTNEMMGKEIKIELTQLLFLSMIFFSILFGIYSLIALNLIRNKKVKDNTRENWFLYKIITLIYLSCFTFIYLLILMYKNNIVRFGLHANALAKHQNYVLGLFPYFIHLLNGILMFSFYFELKFVNLTLSENLEVDYLFEDSNKNVF